MSEASVRGWILNYIIGSIAAVGFFALIGLTDALDDTSAQHAAGQVMACSKFPVECAEFERLKHATATTNRRQ